MLLSALSNSRSQCETRPLFSVCHSVGGLLLKQALCISREQPYQHGSILNSVAGIIFLGTPHSGLNDSESLSRLLTLLAKTNGIKRINIPGERRVHEQAMLGRLAARFESIDLRSSVLTIWETEKTRVSEGLLKSKMLLVRTSHREKSRNNAKSHFRSSLRRGFVLYTLPWKTFCLSPLIIVRCAKWNWQTTIVKDR